MPCMQKMCFICSRALMLKCLHCDGYAQCTPLGKATPRRISLQHACQPCQILLDLGPAGLHQLLVFCQ